MCSYPDNLETNAPMTTGGTRIVDARSPTYDSMVVRTATGADFDAILQLEQAAFPYEPLSARALRRFLDKPHRPVLVARFGERIAGYVVIVVRKDSRAARLYSFAVDPKHARRGVGKELMGACERYARAHGLTALRLEVRYDNQPAIALYQKLGFSEFGRYPAYYGDGAEALRFEKRLEASKSV